MWRGRVWFLSQDTVMMEGNSWQEELEAGGHTTSQSAASRGQLHLLELETLLQPCPETYTLHDSRFHQVNNINPHRDHARGKPIY